MYPDKSILTINVTSSSLIFLKDSSLKFGKILHAFEMDSIITRDVKIKN